MKVEIPELKRCCFCLPLRYGLITFGYIKLISSLIMIGIIILGLIKSATRSNIHVNQILLTVAIILTMALDFCLTIVFLIGGHRKSARLLHAYYIYSIVLLCLYTLFFTLSTAILLYHMPDYIGYMEDVYFIRIIQIRILDGIFNFGIQVYVIILIRSEVSKLRKSSKYRFENLSAEAEDPYLEDRTNEQGINYPKEGFNENGTDRQFEGIVNKTDNNIY